MKIRPVVVELFHTDGKTHRPTVGRTVRHAGSRQADTAKLIVAFFFAIFGTRLNNLKRVTNGIHSVIMRRYGFPSSARLSL